MKKVELNQKEKKCKECGALLNSHNTSNMCLHHKQKIKIEFFKTSHPLSGDVTFSIRSKKSSHQEE